MTTTPGDYPSPDEIMRTEYVHQKETIDVVIKWKKDWIEIRKTTEKNRRVLLASLLYQLAEIYNKPLGRVDFTPNAPVARYLPETWTIELTNTSIITALHELAHHLISESETIACRWSIWLFKKTFPKSFSHLKWQGHRLIKRHDNTQNTNIRDPQNKNKTTPTGTDKPQLEHHRITSESKTQS